MSLCGCGSSGITLYEEDLEWAAQQGYISKADAQSLWPEFKERYEERGKLLWVHLGYFFGAMLVVGSVTWMTSEAWNDATGLSLFWLCDVYVIAFAWVGLKIWRNELPSWVPQVIGGVFVTISVLIVPAAVYALQRYFDYWPQLTPGIFEFLSILVASSLAIYFVRFSFLVAPMTWAIWGLSEVDIAPLIFGPDPSQMEQAYVSIACGAGLLLGAFSLDQFQKRRLVSSGDFAFWAYLFGTLAFWGGLTSIYGLKYPNELGYQLFYLAINLGMCGLSVPLQRGVFVVFGAIGTAGDIGDLMYQYFSASANAWSSIVFGSIIVAASWLVQTRGKPSNFPTFGYWFGAIALGSGINYLYNVLYNSVFYGFFYFLANIGLCAMVIPTQANIFFWVGFLGCDNYVWDLVHRYFWNSLWLPVILTVLGLTVIALAVWFSRKSKKAEQKKNQDDLELVEKEGVNQALLAPMYFTTQMPTAPQPGFHPIVWNPYPAY